MSATKAGERIFVAIGSNLGNRAQCIHRAIDDMRAYAHLVDTSFLYTSRPMYVQEQPQFLNAVAEVRSDLPPHAFLHELKRTEEKLGRTAGERFGPRTIDLDIVLYGNRQVEDDTPPHPIAVPHVKIAERPFVLTPLADIDPHLEIPGVGKVTQQCEPTELTRVTALADGSLLSWDGRTKLMGIVNATPDSFSDGGEHANVDDAVDKAGQFLEAGFDIVDVGGVSTRPGAGEVDEEVEMRRVLPIIGAIRKHHPNLAISVDTFRGAVARAAVTEGAAIINDVGGGTWCEDMLQAAVSTRAAWVAMHARGRPADMVKHATYNDVVGEVARELGSMMQRGRRAGVHRWSMISDGGIGFAKDASHNDELIRAWSEFKDTCGGYPTLLGLSRKRFLQRWSTRPAASDRDWATAGAAVAAVIRGGVDIVRVHHPSVGDAVRAAEALSAD